MYCKYGGESSDKGVEKGINSSKVYCKFRELEFLVSKTQGINSSKVYCKLLWINHKS